LKGRIASFTGAGAVWATEEVDVAKTDKNNRTIRSIEGLLVTIFVYPHRFKVPIGCGTKSHGQCLYVSTTLCNILDWPGFENGKMWTKGPAGFPKKCQKQEDQPFYTTGH